MSGTWVPPVDVAETQEKILVRAEVPGMKQEDIQIEFENGLLTIRGERKLEKTEGMTWHRVERIYGNFSRSFTLPRTVDRGEDLRHVPRRHPRDRGAEEGRGEAEEHPDRGDSNKWGAGGPRRPFHRPLAGAAEAVAVRPARRRPPIGSPATA